MTETLDRSARLAHRLLQLGAALFLLGLITGLLMPLYANARMGLTSHLEGLLNGLMLLVLGLLWPRLGLGPRAQVVAFWLAVYSAFVNWLSTLLAALWGAGGPIMPLAAGGYEGTSAQEAIIAFGLLSISVTVIVVFGMVLYGLRGGPARVA